jgi:multisubunit Na+/H+ antiporter MnhG subunit
MSVWVWPVFLFLILLVCAVLLGFLAWHRGQRSYSPSHEEDDNGSVNLMLTLEAVAIHADDLIESRQEAEPSFLVLGGIDSDSTDSESYSL